MILYLVGFSCSQLNRGSHDSRTAFSTLWDVRSPVCPHLFVAYIKDIADKVKIATVEICRWHQIVPCNKNDKSWTLQIFPAIRPGHNVIMDHGMDWHLNLVVNKCSTILGGKTTASTYYFHSTNVKKSSCDCNSGITISGDLHWTRYISKTVKKAEGILASLSNTFVGHSPAIYLRLYKAMMQPHLEFASPLWNPYSGH